VNVLGIDTSTAATAACLLRSDGIAFEVIPSLDDLQGPPAHARELMPALARVVDEAGVGFDGVDALAVGRGPGGFTGLRIGIATARALASARGLAVHAVSSLEALAAGAEAPLVLAIVDAKRKEVFAALYEEGEERWAPFAADPREVAERIQVGALSPLAAGDGAVRFREPLEAAGAEVPPDGSPVHAVRALQVCRLAARMPAIPPEAVLPDYLRAPDAQPQR
jgi:tRNA threonylcarbamoyladenosine biosynthesis protein TsaB